MTDSGSSVLPYNATIQIPPRFPIIMLPFIMSVDMNLRMVAVSVRRYKGSLYIIDASYYSTPA